MIRLTRRDGLLTAGLLPLLSLARRARAETGIGTVAEVSGDASLVRDGATEPLTTGAALAEGDTAITGENALALLMLETDTRINMGPAAQVVLARYLADVGGTINISGAIVFDRPDDMAPIDLTFSTEFGEIGVRGTRFFAGPSKGSFAVFCDRGSVSVTGAGVSRVLAPGDGVNMAADTAPTEVAQWKEARIAEAFASVGLTR